MSLHEILGLSLVLAGLVLVSLLILSAGWSARLQHLVLGGLWLRVGGALGYLLLVGVYYGGGDYHLYTSEGLRYAETLLNGDLEAIVGPWTQGQWWGTRFTIHLAGIVYSVVGPTLPGVSIVFAVCGYLGILAMAAAYVRGFPRLDWRRYLTWVVLFPSLWFWPSALGKDAIVLFGIGLVTLSFVGRRGRIGWLGMAVGGLLVFGVRPQVAATLAFALVAGHWMGLRSGWNFGRVLQGTGLVILGVATLSLSSGALEVELFQPEEVGIYLESRAARSMIGGSAIDQQISPWLAPINTLFRPFPWEARGITAILSSIEVLVLWGLAWIRRREIRTFVRNHRRSRLFWMGLIFILTYSTALGMSLGNLGIIARQRVHILPFLFMFIVGASRHSRVHWERSKVSQQMALNPSKVDSMDTG